MLFAPPFSHSSREEPGGDFLTGFGRCRGRIFLWAFFIFAALAVSSARAQITGSLQISELTSYSGIAIEPAGTHGLAARGFYTISNPQANSQTATFSLRFRLLSSNGAPVNITTQTGAVGTEYRATFTRTLPPHGGNDEDQRVSLIPQQALVPGAPYHVEVQMFRESPSATFLGLQNSANYRFQILPPDDPPAGAYQLRALVNSTQLLKTYAVATVPTQDTFRIRALGVLGRFDHLNDASAGDAVSLHLDVIVTGSGGNDVPLENARTTIPVTLANHTASGDPAGVAFDQTIGFKPAGQLDSTDTYTVTILASYTTPDAVETSDESLPIANQRLLAFNGTVLFGNISTTLHALNSATTPGTPVSGGISTGIDVPSGGATIDGAAGITWSASGILGPLAVVLRADGVAVSSGTVFTSGSGTVTLNGITFTRSSATLGPSGARATITVRLPTGFGYSSSKAVRTLDSSFVLTNATLDADLLPTNTTWTPSGGGVRYACEESKPLWIEITGFTWNIAAGTIEPLANGSAQYVRSPELNTLEANANSYSDHAAALKPSNDGYFRFVNFVTGPLVRATGNGTALLELGLFFGAGNFHTHFPYDAVVSIDGNGGVAQISNDLFDTANSTLPVTTPIQTPHGVDCVADGCSAPGGAGQPLLLFQPASALRFTPDGGLQAPGALTAATDLNWGYSAGGNYAHQALALSAAEFFMPGNALAGAMADSSVLPADERPGDLLLSGRGLADDPNFVDRAGTAEYQSGAADYAGINFRVGADGAYQGRSYLAAVSIDYPLRGNAKYYARRSGVSGVHEATPGSTSGEFKFSGYPTTINGLQFSFLSNKMERSLVTGNFDFKEPTNMKLDFENLTFSCNGGIKSVTLPPSNGTQHLDYWDADLTPLTLEFKRGAGLTCNPLVGYAVMSVDAGVSHVAQPCRGVLGIYPPFHVGGNPNDFPSGLEGTFMAPNAEGFPLEARFGLPSVIQLAGPPNQPPYTITPITSAYYSKWVDGQPGFVAFAGLLKVAFFEAVPIFVQTSGKFNVPPEATAPAVYMMDALARTPWADESGNFLTNKNFDQNNRGLPASLSLTNFRNLPDWQPVAKKQWQDFLRFTDIPLQWSSSTRAFTSNDSGNVRLPIFPIDIRTTAAYLSSDIADLRFAKSFELSSLSLASMLYDATVEFTGFRDALQNGVGSAVSAPLTAGLKSLDRLLNDDANALLRPSLDSASASVASVLATTLAGQDPPLPGGDPAFLTHSVDAANTAIDTLPAFLPTSLLATDGSLSVIKELNDTLGSARSAVGALRTVVAKNGGQRNVAANLAKQMVVNLIHSPALAGVVATALGGLSDQFFNEEIARLDPSFSALDATLSEIDGRLAALQSAAGGEILSQLSTAISGPALTPVTTKAKALLETYIRSFDTTRSDRNPFAELNPAVLQAEIQRRIRDAFIGAPIAGEVQMVLRERVGDADAALRAATGSIFQQVNTVIRNGAAKSLSAAANDLTSLAGNANLCAMAKIDGSAIIRGDALKSLRLDGRFKMTIGLEIAFNAFLQINDRSNVGPPTNPSGLCVTPAGVKRTEVTLGVDQARLDWLLGSDCTASADARFTFDNGDLVGLSGMFDVTGAMKLEVIEIQEARFGLSLGAGEAYIAAGTRSKIDGWEFAGGLFLGLSCNLKPLAIADPTILTPDSFFSQEAVNADHYPFAGVYTHVEGWVPINEIFGIPSSCLLQLTAGAGYTYFLNLADLPQIELGGRYLYGIEGRILCLVTVRGQLQMTERVKVPSLDLTDIGLRLAGSVTFSGYLPDIEVLGEHIGLPYSLTLDAYYDNGKFGIDTF